MRLDKFLSHATGLSRDLSRRAIRNHRVTVDDQPVRSAAHSLQGDEIITLDGAPVRLPGKRYLMLHKPAGYVCAAQDAEYPVVLDLLETDVGSGLAIGGRLDRDTTGLVLLSDDGQWLHRITAPRHHYPKTYQVVLAEPVTKETVRLFEEGILLNGEKHLTRPAQCRPRPDNRAEVVLHEGRYHQVKRMFAACGNHVLSLHRSQIGGVILDPRLAPGESRALTTSEIEGFNQAIPADLGVPKNE